MRRLSRPRLLAFSALTALGAALLFFVALSELAHRTALAGLEAELAAARAGRFQRSGVRLLVVGDSFTAGELSESGVGWWAHLPELLPGTETISLALAGSPTRTHLAQVRAWKAESGQQATAIVAVTGANNLDSLDCQRRYVAAGGRAPLWLRPLYLRGGGPMYGLHYLGGRLGVMQPGDPEQVMWAPLKAAWYRNEAYERWAIEDTERLLGELAGEGRLILGSYVAHNRSTVLREAAGKLELPFFDHEGPVAEQRADE
jgi:hypothetical protein